MKGLLCLLLFISVYVHAQTKWYVAAKAGLSIREKPDVKANVIGKVPYGSSIAVSYPDSTINISVEGFSGAWAKTTFGGKSGYVINSYLLPDPPPKAAIKTMKQYLAQLSTVTGPALLVKKGSIQNLEEGGSETRKQLYKNGAEYHSVSGYEWHNDTYFLPDFTMEQGFVLLRLIPEFNSIFSEKDPFPTKNTTIKKSGIEYDVKIETETFGDNKWIKRIVVEFADGAVNTFEMFQLGNQLVISFGGGV